jgi:hypothetical protein
VFSLTPSATVDEGNNWINVSWGPLALSDDSVTGGANGNYGGGNLFANYGLAVGSQAIDFVPVSQANLPTATDSTLITDFYGNPRPDPANLTLFDIGAIEYQSTNQPPTFTSLSPNTGYRGTTFSVTITGNNLGGTTNVTVSGTGVAVTNIQPSSTTITATFTISATAALSARNLTITAGGGTVTATNAFSVLGPSITSFSPNPLLRSTTATAVSISGADLLGATAVTISGGVITCTGIASSGTAAASTVTANCTSTATAATGARTVTVTTPNGVTPTFAINVSGPTLTSINPTSGSRGATNIPMTLTGTNLQNSSVITVSGTGVTCSIGSPAPTSTTVNALCSITNGAGTAARNVSVGTSTNGTTNTLTGAFTVRAGTVVFSTPIPAMNSGGTTTKNATITVSNTATGATAGPITLTANPSLGTKGGTGNGTFSIQPGGTCVSGFAINPGSSCTINLRYSGETNTANATDTVSITGTGIGNNATGVASASFTAN